MSKKSILKIILVVLIIFILSLVFLWFFYKDNTPSNDNHNNIINNKNYNSLNRNSSVNNTNQQINKVDSIVEFTSIAKLVAERFGSYSSDTHNFANLRDMRSLMTDKMRQWIDNLIDSLLIDNSLPKEYYGVTTKALSVKTVSYNKEQDVEVVVLCQKTETKGDNNPTSKTKYQDLKIKMIYIDKKWLIDELEWE